MSRTRSGLLYTRISLNSVHIAHFPSVGNIYNKIINCGVLGPIQLSSRLFMVPDPWLSSRGKISPQTICKPNILGERHLIIKFGARVGHLNSFLVLRDRNLNKPIFKSLDLLGRLPSAYNCRMQFLVRALLASHKKSHTTLVIQHCLYLRLL